MNTTTLVPFLSTQLTQITTTITTTDGSKLLLTTITIAANKYNKVDNFSPITLSPYWSRLARLLLISLLSVIGSVGNVFMISSVMIEDHLKKAGKLFFSSISSFLHSIFRVNLINFFTFSSI